MQETIKRSNNDKYQTDLTVIIYGSRFNSGMKSFGPKFLYKDGYGRPIIESQIRCIQEVYPLADIVIVAGFEIEKLLRLKTDKIRIVENQLFEETNEIEDIRLGINNTHKKNILTIAADLHFNKYALMSITEKPTLVFDTKHQLKDSDLGITMHKNLIEHIDLSLENKWCHIAYFENKHFNTLGKLCMQKNNKLFLFEVLNEMITQGYIFKAVEPNSMLIKKLHTPDKLRSFKSKCVS